MNTTLGAGCAAGWARLRRAHHRALLQRRKRWLQVHLWLGLTLGGFLSLFGLTGAVLVFHSEIDHGLNPAFFTTAVPAHLPRIALDAVRVLARQHAPIGTESINIILPKTAEQTYLVAYWIHPHTPAPEEAMVLNLSINAYTGDIVGRRVFYHAWNPLKHSFVGFFFRLHYALLLGDRAIIVVGAIGVLLVISALTGLILWWPLDGKWRRALTVKRNASAVRLNHDVHQLAGATSLVVLLAVLTSGLYFNLPEQFKWMVNAFSTLTLETLEQVVPPDHASVPTAQSPLSLDVWRARIEHAVPGGDLDSIALPITLGGPTQACYRHVRELRSYVVDHRCISADTATARVLHVSDARSGSAGDTFLQWQWPLHSGQALGWVGRILVFICGLACPLLFVTGLIRWQHKRRAKRPPRPWN